MNSSINKKGTLYGIGIGPGDPELLTLKAAKAIENADIIYVPKSHEQQSTALNIVANFIPEKASIIHLEFPMSHDINVRINARKENAKQINNELNLGKQLVFLTLGDPMLYSTYSYILEYIHPSHNIQTIPGIYSFSAISSIMSMPLVKGDEKLAVICTYDNTSQQLLNSVDTVVCMKVSGYNNELYSYLRNRDDYNFTMITDAGKADQKIYNSIEVLTEAIPYFSTIIIQNKKLNICQQ